ncbi:Fic family protein [Sphingomonas sp. SORGH_AS_0879]|uniref:Fic family protein n=1 Tax=Sphingomonas sp. SORGH_AS_0879 TaxID=3041790 RepID=UPI002785A483|nr:Fic/DOC family N-terminal domain-containing protein [Sphingomonas sp. SORGH_AS_0879]MDQ1228640.1 Fic family protein [Sphingomonas sp. SORGH_AS_0879]
MRRDDLCHAVRERLQRLPEPHAAHYGVVPLPPPGEGIPLGTAMASHQRAIEALARVRALAADMADPYVVSRLLVRREAVSSSSIEGTNSTLDELLSLEEEAGEEQRDAARQVRDYALTLDRLIPRAAGEGAALFTPELVAELHREVMRSDPRYADAPGMLRTHVVWIGGGGHDIAYSTYNPTPPDRIETCLAESMAYMRGQGMQVMTQSIVARLAIAHAHFEAVHPFRDGNGRVGRLLMPLMMAADGQVPLYLSPYIEANRQAYHDSLKAAQQRLDWSAAIAFIADAITGTVDELMVTRAALTRLVAAWHGRRAFRRNSAARRALPLLADYPVITARRLGERLRVSAPSAHGAIEQLVQAGILHERTGYSRNRVFAANEVLGILNRPFGAEPIEEVR